MPANHKTYTVEVSMCVSRTYIVTAPTEAKAKAQARDLIYHAVMIDDPDVRWDYEVGDNTRALDTPPWVE